MKNRPIKYIVVSSPRSGTGYTAEVLSHLGLNCGHETWFFPGRTIYHKRGEEFWGDSSWLATPYLDKMPPTTLVLHQLRNPIKTLDSMMARRQLRGCKPGGKGPRGEYTKFLKLYFENWESEESQQDRLARFWVEWNLKIEEQENNPNLRYLRFKIEDMNEELLLSITSLIGAPMPNPKQLQLALKTSKNTNHRVGQANRITPWAEEFLGAKDNEAAERVRSFSKRYGY